MTRGNKEDKKEGGGISDETKEQLMAGGIGEPGTPLLPPLPPPDTPIIIQPSTPMKTAHFRLIRDENNLL